MKQIISPHFRKAVAEIDEDIANLNNDITRLQTARSTIMELYGGDTEIPDKVKPRKTSSRGGPRRSKPVGAEVTRREAAQPPPADSDRPAGVSGRHSTESVAVMAIARTMAEPISITTLSVASGKDKKFCGNRISRWAANGWLAKTGYGEYKRTNTFPAQA
jgi:hypothetical protein